MKMKKTFEPPVYLQIEPTTRCNYQCIMCSRKSVKRPLIDLQPSKYAPLLKELPNLEYIHLQGLGEPFLCKHLELLAAISRAFTQARIIVTTNGSIPFSDYLTSFNEIRVSLHTLDPDRYKYITGGNLEQVTENIVEAIAIKNEYSLSTKFILTNVISYINRDEISDLKVWGIGMGFDEVRIIDVENWYTPFEDNPTKELIMESREYGELKDRVDTCQWCLTSAYVSADGWLTPCCIRMNPETYNLGNVFEEPFMDVWNGKEANWHRENRRLICGNCPNI